MTPEEALAAELQGLEELLLVPDVRKSTRVAELLADKFEFGGSGRVYTKDDLVRSCAAESPVDDDVRLQSHLPGARRGALDLRTRRHLRPVVDALRSSIWRRAKGRWQMVFHQGTVTAHQSIGS